MRSPFSLGYRVDESGNRKQSLSVDVETPTSTAQTIITQLHAQPLNINILSWKKSTIEDILAGLRSGRIHVASRPQGSCHYSLLVFHWLAGNIADLAI
jgi:hypothetical protein